MLIQKIVEIRHKTHWIHYATIEECVWVPISSIHIRDLMGRLMPKIDGSLLEARTRWVILNPRGDHTRMTDGRPQFVNEFWFVPYIVAPRKAFWYNRWMQYDPFNPEHISLGA